MPVRIYQPSKTAMQSGRAKTHVWILEHEPSARQDPEPLMGWAGSADTRRQVRLRFDTKEEAISYASRNGLAYTVIEHHDRTIKPKAYAENFAHTRRQSWTH